MECWNREIIAFYAVICQGRKLVTKPGVSSVSAVGVYLPEGRHPIIPFFQHSIIPISCERSELSSKFLSLFSLKEYINSDEIPKNHYQLFRFVLLSSHDVPLKG
jgi:hypothetical protein